jgi:hypothetical protein
MPQTISLKIDNKYSFLLKNKSKIQKIALDFFEDYLEELTQDNITRQKLENNKYDKKLNNKISAKL